MATTVHLPAPLLTLVDGRARELGLSRNRYIVQALERAIHAETQWSPDFVALLDEARENQEGQEALAELREAIAANRTSKAPPRL